MAAPLVRSTAIATLLLAGTLTRLPAQSDSLPHTKSPQTAFLLSLGATVIPYAIAGATYSDNQDPKLAAWAIFFGPAVGHFYAGNSNQAWKGIGIRAGVAVAATAVGFSSCTGNNFDDDWDCGSTVFAIGGLVILASDIYDIATAGRSAREHNAKLAHPVSMIMVPLSNGVKTRMGVGMKVEF